MCGVVGVFLLNTEVDVDPVVRRKIAHWLHNEVLYRTLPRGKDATGFVANFMPREEGQEPVVILAKQPVGAPEFFENDGSDPRYSSQKEYENINSLTSIMQNIPMDMSFILGHTRKKTLGTELVPHNNHPLVVGNIIGIHNGGVANHDTIFDNHKDTWTRLGDVDSEAIIQLFAETANDRALTLEDIDFVTERITGPRAVMAFNSKHPETVAFFRSDKRPLEVAYIPELGILVLHSERDFLKKSLNAYTRLRLFVADFPKITADYHYLGPGKGGIIDLNKPYDGKENILTFCGTRDYADKLLPEYDPDEIAKKKREEEAAAKKAAEEEKKVEYSKTCEEEDEGSFPAVVYERNKHKTIIKDSSSYDEDDDSFGMPYQLTSGSSKDDETVVADVYTLKGDTLEVEELDYSPKKNKNSSKTSFMEGEDEDEDEEEEEGDELILGELDLEEVKEKAVKIALSKEQYENKNSIFGRYEDYRKLVSAPLDEKIKEEIITAIYPEIFIDGFLEGCLYADEAYEGMSSLYEDAVEERDDIKKKLQQKTDALKRASVVLANMKGFIMACLIYGKMVDIDGDSLVLEDDFDTFLQTARHSENKKSSFSGVSTKVVMKLFAQKDIDLINNFLSGNKPQMKKAQ